MPTPQKSLILVVDQNNLQISETIESGSFVDLKIWERKHIQEWIVKQPEILGEELLVLSTEFDRFVESSDRLDILSLDKKGNLVIVELKRDSLAGYADLQALRYAAMISSLTLKMTLPYFAKFHNRQNPESIIEENKAEEIIKDFVETEFNDFSNKPRIILCSENFSTELTTTVLWLRDFEVDISCVRIRPHQIGEKVVIIPTRIIPLPEAVQYQTSIQRKEEAILHEKTNRTKRPTSIRMLVDAGLLKMGDILTLSKSHLPQNLQGYFDGREPNFYKAEITGKQGKANNVKWLFDGGEYSISNLCYVIFTEIHPEKQHPGALAGGEYWLAPNGKTLYNWADEVWKSKSDEI
jgi:hypothetical protein